MGGTIQFKTYLQVQIQQDLPNLPVDILKEEEPRRLADILENVVGGEGEDDVCEVGAER